MRFEVPQFIEIEDKIFGPFTWKQFVYLMGGVGTTVVLFITMPFFIFVLFGLPIGGLAILLAFYPVNNQPFSVYLESMLRFLSGKKLYLWKKTNTAAYTNAPAAQDPVLQAQQAQNVHIPTVTKNKLSSLSRSLELDAIENNHG